MPTVRSQCPRCGNPAVPSKRGFQSAWAGERGRGTGFPAGETIPARCSDAPRCDWDERDPPSDTER